MIVADTFLDYPDKESHALIVYLSGCDFSCEDCHNKEMQKEKPKGMNPFQLYLYLLEESKKYGNTNKLVLSGGDPLSTFNIAYTREFLGINEYFDICIYSGENIYSVPKDLTGFKFIKLGRYQKYLAQEQVKNDDFLQFSSKNQLLINSNYESLTTGGKYKYV